MDSKPELINCQPGDNYEVSLKLDGLDYEQAKDTLGKLKNFLDNERD